VLLEAHPNWTPMQVREALMMTASNHASPNNDYGWGIINVMAAINYYFGPLIMQRFSLGGYVHASTRQHAGFLVMVNATISDSLTYHWYVDGVEAYAGPDSFFSQAWLQPDTSEVKAVVVDRRGSADSTTWTVIVQPITGLASSDHCRYRERMPCAPVIPIPSILGPLSDLTCRRHPSEIGRV